MTLRLYRAIFVEIHALFPEILRFEFVTLFMKHPVKPLSVKFDNEQVSSTNIEKRKCWLTHSRVHCCKPLLCEKSY